MKLQRLAGYGPLAAFVSAALMLIVAVVQQAGAAVSPSLYAAVAVVFLIGVFLWLGTLTVTVFDLEWLEHPATRRVWLQVALVATLVAMLMPVVLGLIVFAGLGVPYALAWAVLFLGVGFSLLVHNLEARRAHLLDGVLPWVGIASGACFVLIGILQVVVMFTTAFVVVWFYGLVAAEITFVVWAVWLGVHLNRTKTTATAAQLRPKRLG